jgi:hypothetical protein
MQGLSLERPVMRALQAALLRFEVERATQWTLTLERASISFLRELQSHGVDLCEVSR